MKTSNFQAQQELNNEYAHIKGASSINDVAKGFGKGWIVFAILSALASAFSFYQDFNKSIGVVATLLLVVILATALETFKHLSIKGMFSDMHLLSRSIVTVVAIGLIGISFYTHYKSIQTFQRNLVKDDLKTEISYQRDLQKIQNGQISTILASNLEFSKALNNGSSHDDTPSSDSVQSNNQLIATLQKLAAQNNMTNTNLLLQESRSSAKTTASAILIIFFMVEIMALFSILSKVIVIDNVDSNFKSFSSLLNKLDELKNNVYNSLGEHKIIETQEEIKAVQSQNQIAHKERLKAIAYNHPTPNNNKENHSAYRPNNRLPFCSINNIYSNSTTFPYNTPKNNEVYTLLESNNNSNLPTVYQVPKTPVKYGESNRIPDSKSYEENHENIFETERVEEGEDEFEKSKKSSKKVPAIDLKIYSDNEKKLLKQLFDNGAITVNQNLVSRRIVLKEVGIMMKKHNTLSLLYEKLLEQGLIDKQPVHPKSKIHKYIALAELHHEAWQEK